jgi:hypothetical protein
MQAGDGIAYPLPVQPTGRRSPEAPLHNHVRRMDWSMLGLPSLQAEGRRMSR